MLRRAAPPAAGGITWLNLLAETLADADEPTSSISVTSGTTLFVAHARATTGAASCTIENSIVTGTGLTCTNRVSVSPYGFRRTLWLTTCEVTSGGSITVNIDTSGCGGTFDGAGVLIDEATGIDQSDPLTGAVCSGDDTAGTSETTSIGSAPGASDHVYSVFGHEDATKTLTDGSENGTELVELKSITGVRQIVSAYDDSPDATPAPSITWSGNNHSGGCAAIVDIDP